MVDLCPAMVLLEATGLGTAVGGRFAGGSAGWWSTRARFATSPGPPVRWPRPTLSMRRCWPTGRRSFATLRDAESQPNSLTARRHHHAGPGNRLGTATARCVPASKTISGSLGQGVKAVAVEVQYGARRTTFCAPFPAWGSNSLSPCWPTSPSWALWTDGRSRPWWAWRLQPRPPCEADAPSGADAPGFGVFSTWGR